LQVLCENYQHQNDAFGNPTLGSLKVARPWGYGRRDQGVRD
jgi:hypothetical protein